MNIVSFFTKHELTTKNMQWWMALVGYVLAIMCAMAPSMVLGMMVPDEQQFKDMSVYVLPLQYALMFVLGVGVIRLVRGKKFAMQDIGFMGIKNRAEYVYAAVAAALFLGLSFLVQYLSPELGDAGKKVIGQVGMGENMLRDVMVVTAAAIMAPLGEEMLYRGMIFRGLHDWMNARKAKLARALAFIVPAVASAWLFAISHGGEGQDKQALYLTIFGVMMAWLYWKTKSIEVPVVAHSFVNMVNFLMMATATGGKVSPVVYVYILATPIITLGILKLTKSLLGGVRK